MKDKIHDALNILTKAFSLLKKVEKFILEAGDDIKDSLTETKFTCPRCRNGNLQEANDHYLCFLCSYMIKREEFHELADEINR